MRVLVVYDSPAYLAACVAVLPEDGHEVSGESAGRGGRAAMSDCETPIRPQSGKCPIRCT
jgi:hypothetical protein